MFSERSVPHSTDAETAILGAILMDNSCLGVVKKWIRSPEAFYSGNNRRIFKTIVEMLERGAPVDLVTLHDELTRRGDIDKIGGAVYLANLTDFGTPAMVEYYAKLVWHAAVKRQIIEQASELVDTACETGSPDAKALISKYTDQMREVTEVLAREDGVLNIQTTLGDFMKEIEEAQAKDGMSGIPFGIGSLDRVTGGMHSGDIITIVARLGTGKTWFELLLQKNGWIARKRSLFISMEMSTESIRRRFMAMVAGVSNMDLRLGRLSDAQITKVTNACGQLYGTEKEAPLYVIGSDLIDGVRDIDAFIDGLRPDVCFVDGVYLLDEDKKGDMWVQTTRVIRNLKRVAARRKIPIVTAAQFNRDAVKKGGMGGAEDIGFTDAIGQTSDVVIALAQNEDQAKNRQMVVRCLKNREGIKVEFIMLWDLDRMLFQEIRLDEDGLEERIEF
jgi:replicative DNA helicase